MTRAAGKLALSTSHDRRGSQSITLALPAGLILDGPMQGIGLKSLGGSSYEVVVPEGVTALALQIVGA